MRIKIRKNMRGKGVKKRKLKEHEVRKLMKMIKNRRSAKNYERGERDDREQGPSGY